MRTLFYHSARCKGANSNARSTSHDKCLLECKDLAYNGFELFCWKGKMIKAVKE